MSLTPHQRQFNVLSQIVCPHLWSPNRWAVFCTIGFCACIDNFVPIFIHFLCFSFSGSFDYKYTSLYYQEEGQALVSRLLDRMMKCDKYGERRGAAFGLAGVVKGFGIPSLKKYGIAAILRQSLEDRLVISATSRLWIESVCIHLSQC